MSGSMEVMAASTLAWWFASTALILIGIAGTVLPALPGTVFVLAGIVLGAWIDDFTRVSGWTVVIIAALGALAWATDFVAAALGAKKAGASTAALIGAGIGTVLGIFTGLVGLLFMPLAGAVAGELYARRDEWAAGGIHAAGAQATRVGIATWLGMLVGTAVKLALTFVMVGIFVAALVF